MGKRTEFSFRTVPETRINYNRTGEVNGRPTEVVGGDCREGDPGGGGTRGHGGHRAVEKRGAVGGWASLGEASCAEAASSNTARSSLGHHLVPPEPRGLGFPPLLLPFALLPKHHRPHEASRNHQTNHDPTFQNNKYLRLVCTCSSFAMIAIAILLRTPRLLPRRRSAQSTSHRRTMYDS